MKTIFTIIIILILGGAIAFFAFINPEVTSINLYKTQIEASQGLIFIACALAGFLLATLLYMPIWIAQKIKITTLSLKCSKLSKTVDKKDKTIDKKDAALDAKDDALDELSDEIEKHEKIDVIKDALLPWKK